MEIEEFLLIKFPFLSGSRLRKVAYYLEDLYPFLISRESVIQYDEKRDVFKITGKNHQLFKI